MPAHEPQKVARLIEKRQEFAAEARELLEHVGAITEPVYYDVGANKVLVVVPGWGVLADPADYLLLASEVA